MENVRVYESSCDLKITNLNVNNRENVGLCKLKERALLEGRVYFKVWQCYAISLSY